MKIGTCTCICGSDGSPCSHQLAISIHFHKVGLNCIPTLHPSRRLLAQIAIENEVKSDVSFYASISQLVCETEQAAMMDEKESEVPDFVRMQKVLRDTESLSYLSDDPVKSIDNNGSPLYLLTQLDAMFQDLKHVSIEILICVME